MARQKQKDNCQNCYNLKNSECKHNDNERAITGFWTTVELNKAVEKGYKIIHIYNVWHFEETSDILFKEYIKKFLKLKLETSNVTGSELEYRKKAQKLGIELGQLTENPGLRFIAKMCLNSLWGKLGQNPKVTNRQYIDNYQDFYQLILNDKVESISLSFINDQYVYASYNLENNFIKTSYNANIYLACFTAAHARLRLYNLMEQIDKNVCYCDTDSLIYIENDHSREIVDRFIGDGLGEWTDELNQNYMTYFCCAQPKDYGYILDDGTEVGKVKGFSPNAETEQKMTNEERIKLIKGAIESVGINYNVFRIGRGTITTTPMIKHWGFKFDKRIIKIISDDEIDTLPYGY